MFDTASPHGLTRFVGGMIAGGAVRQPLRPLHVVLADRSLEGLAEELIAAGVLSSEAASVALCEPDATWVADVLHRRGFDGLIGPDGRGWSTPRP